MVYCAGLENRRAARLRGFESHLLRQFPLAPHWSLLTSASWIHLTGSAADSSLVKEIGRPDQGEAQVAVAYKFD